MADDTGEVSVAGAFFGTLWDTVKIWDNDEVAQNYDNLRESGYGVFGSSWNGFLGALGEKFGAGGVADAFDGVSASGERLSTRERVLSGALGVGQVALEVVGAKGAGQLSKRAGREVGEKVGDLWRGAKNWWRGADDVADAGKGGRFGGTHGSGGAKPLGEVPQSISDVANATQLRTLREIWQEKKSLNDLPAAVRQALADHFSKVATTLPEGSAQRAFQEARAKFLQGLGPNPGQGINEFAKLHGLPIVKLR